MRHCGAARNIDPLDGISPKLELLKAEVVDFAHFLSTAQEGTKLDPLDYTESVSSILHRLVHFAPLGGPRPSAPLDNLVHLTLVALMTTLLPTYGYNHPGYPALAGPLISAIQNFKFADPQSSAVLLWAVFTRGVSVLDDRDRAWLLPLLEEPCGQLHLRCNASWAEVRQILTECCWISAVHDKSGYALWEAIQRRRRNG